MLFHVQKALTAVDNYHPRYISPLTLLLSAHCWTLLALHALLTPSAGKRFEVQEKNSDFLHKKNILLVVVCRKRTMEYFIIKNNATFTHIIKLQTSLNIYFNFYNDPQNNSLIGSILSCKMNIFTIISSTSQKWLSMSVCIG